MVKSYLFFYFLFKYIPEPVLSYVYLSKEVESLFSLLPDYNFFYFVQVPILWLKYRMWVLFHLWWQALYNSKL